MRIQDSIKIALDSAQMVAMAYLNDLDDSELMKRPHLQCNHVNWQVGHLILSENQMLHTLALAAVPALPAGFAEQYSPEQAIHDDPAKFCTKAELMGLYQAQRGAVLEALEKATDSDWERETGVSYAPRVIDLFHMIAAHWLMHCGQWVIVRRQVGKPVVI